MKHSIVLLITILLFGCGQSQNSSNTYTKLADSSPAQPPRVDTVTHHQTVSLPSESTANPRATPTSSVEQNTSHADLPSIIESSEVKFDESFNPIATIKLHNSTTKEIDQIQFRFTFTNYDPKSGTLDYVTANDYSSYVNLSVVITPPFEKTVEIKVPLPQRKNFDTPEIFITKVRYYDGTIDTDDR